MTTNARTSLLCIVLFLSLAACDDQKKQMSPPPPPSVTVAKPIRKTITEWDEYVGRFEAIDSVDIRARVSGYIESINFTDGQIVNKDQLLFVIDRRPYEIALQQAKASLTQSRTQFTFAEREFERAKALVKDGTLSRSTYDERLQAVQEARASVKVAEAGLAEARLNLDYTEVRAPVAGRISRRLVSKGSLITGGSESATLLTNIVSMDPIYFYFDVPESAYLKYSRLAQSSDRPHLREHTYTVFIALLDEKEFHHQGLTNFLENIIDRNSGTISIRAVVPNPENLLIQGLFGKVRLPGRGAHEALLVPDAIIGSDQSRKFVMAVDDKNIARPRPVEIGPVVDGLRVVRKGIVPTDTLIVNGLLRARPGMPVTPQDGVIEAAAN